MKKLNQCPEGEEEPDKEKTEKGQDGGDGAKTQEEGSGK